MLNAESIEEGKGKGQNKQESPQGKDVPRAKGEDTGRRDNRLKAQNKPQCFKWAQDEGCPYGINCQYTHSAEVKGKCYNCGATDHMKPACTRPGGGSYDENVENKPKGKGKGESKSAAKTQVASSPSSADHPNGGTASSSSTSGVDSVDIKVIKEVQELLKSMKLARLRVSTR